VRRAQLLALGLTSRQISSWLASGRLIGVYTGVYAVGHLLPSPVNRAHAAVLACGPGALLCRASAAALWGWRRDWPATPEVCSACDRRPTGIAVSLTRTLTDTDRDCERGIPVTSPARTFLDIAPTLSDAQLTRLYNDGRRGGLLRDAAIAELLRRLPTAPSAPRIRRMMTGLNPTRSELEDAFLAFAERYGLPRPQTNVIVAGYEVDMCYPEHKLIIELDSWTFHGDREAFERDRERDSATAALSYRTVRLTHRRLNQAEADRLRAMLTA
jgi:very-short-patch-repair endonuclease